MKWEMVEQRMNRQPAGRQQPLEAAAAAQSSDTILLNGETNGAAAQVKRLTALEPGTEDIVIAYYPFIIGKQETW